MEGTKGIGPATIETMRAMYDPPGLTRGQLPSPRLLSALVRRGLARTTSESVYDKPYRFALTDKGREMLDELLAASGGGK